MFWFCAVGKVLLHVGITEQGAETEVYEKLIQLQPRPSPLQHTLQIPRLFGFALESKELYVVGKENEHIDHVGNLAVGNGAWVLTCLQPMDRWFPAPQGQCKIPGSLARPKRVPSPPSNHMSLSLQIRESCMWGGFILHSIFLISCSLLSLSQLPSPLLPLHLMP